MVLKRRAAALTAVVMLWGALALPSVAVGAEPTSRPSEPEFAAVVSVELTPDCSRLPTGPQAEKLLREYGICDYSNAGAGGITPDSTVIGPCGYLSLYLENAGGGYVLWDAGMGSTLGPFVTASYAGYWTNSTRHTTGSVRRFFVGFTSNWIDMFPIYTRSGYVYGRITSAILTTWWGLICTNTYVVDSWVYVS